jgi:hypothetical protein
MTTPKKAIPATKYDPEMCQKLIEMGKLGHSQRMMWAELGISKGVAEGFKKKYPDFVEALDLALVHSQAYWEREILANVGNKAFNSRLAEIALRGQFGETYRETRDTKVDVKPEITINFGEAVRDLIQNLKKAGE